MKRGLGKGGGTSRGGPSSNEQAFQGGGHFGDVETVRAGASCVGDFPIGAEDKEAIWPSAVGEGNGVGEVIDEDGDIEFEGSGAGGSDFEALVEGFRLLDFDVFGGPWAIGGVGFADVDPVEIGAVFEGLVGGLQAPGLLGERASGVRSENEDGSFFRGGEIYDFACGQGNRFHDRGGIADFGCLGAAGATRLAIWATWAI